MRNFIGAVRLKKLLSFTIMFLFICSGISAEASVIDMEQAGFEIDPIDNNQVIEDDYGGQPELNQVVATVPSNSGSNPDKKADDSLESDDNMKEPGELPVTEKQNEPDRNNVVPDDKEDPLQNNEGNNRTDKISNLKVPVQKAAEPVISVIFPTILDFTIDPLEILEKGQIFSDTFLFENNSNVDVRIILTDLVCRFANDQDFRALASPYEEKGDIGLKDICLYLQNVSEWSDEMEIPEEWVITDDNMPGEVSFILSCDKNAYDNTAVFKMGGSVAPSPDKIWEDNDVKVEMTIRVEPVLDNGMEKIDLDKAAENMQESDEVVDEENEEISANIEEALQGQELKTGEPVVSTPEPETILLPSGDPEETKEPDITDMPVPLATPAQEETSELSAAEGQYTAAEGGMETGQQDRPESAEESKLKAPGITVPAAESSAMPPPVSIPQPAVTVKPLS